jgi:hypothetical protein
MSKTKLINIKSGEPFDVYIGRGRGSIWGNPFTHIKDRETKALYIVDSRKEAISKYKEYLLNNPILMGKIEELRGKTLACYCHPKSCHGDIIIEVLNRNPLF